MVEKKKKVKKDLFKIYLVRKRVSFWFFGWSGSQGREVGWAEIVKNFFYSGFVVVFGCVWLGLWRLDLRSLKTDALTYLTSLSSLLYDPPEFEGSKRLFTSFRLRRGSVLPSVLVMRTTPHTTTPDKVLCEVFRKNPVTFVNHVA